MRKYICIGYVASFPEMKERVTGCDSVDEICYRTQGFIVAMKNDVGNLMDEYQVESHLSYLCDIERPCVLVDGYVGDKESRLLRVIRLPVLFTGVL